MTKKCLRIVLGIVLFMLANGVRTANAQSAGGYVDFWNTMTVTEKTVVTPELHVWGHGPLKGHGPLEGKVSWEGWLLVSQEWSEAIGSVNVAPTDWISVSLGIGFETNDEPIRGAASVWLGKGRWSLLVLQEQGGSGYWYRYVGLCQAKKYLAVGLESAKFFGTGPRVELKVGKASLWGVYAATSDKMAAGLRIDFK